MYRAQTNARIKRYGKALPKLAQDINDLPSDSNRSWSQAYKCFREALNDMETEWAVCQTN